MATTSADPWPNLRPLVSLVMLACTAGALFAQELWTPEQYTSENGLPQNSVVSLAMDADGYLWFTTEGGLVRFDGMNFRPVDLPKGSGSTQGRMRQIVRTVDGSLMVDNAASDLFELRNGVVERSWLVGPAHPRSWAVNGGVCSAQHMRWISAREDTLRGRHLWIGESFRVIPVSDHEWYMAARRCILHYRDTELLRIIPLAQDRNELFFLNGSIYGLDPEQHLFRVDLSDGTVHAARMEGIDIGAVARVRRFWLVDQSLGDSWAYLRDGSDLYLIRHTEDPDVLRAEHIQLELPSGCAINDVLWSDAHRVLMVGTDTKGLFVYRARNMRTRLCELTDASLNNAYYAVAAINDSTTLALSTQHSVVITPGQCALALQGGGWLNYQTILHSVSKGILAARGNEVVVLEKELSSFRVLAKAPENSRVNCFLERGEEVFVGHGQGLGLLKEEEIVDVVGTGSITAMRNVGDEIWCATCSGVLRIDPSTGSVDTLDGIRNTCVRSIEVVGGRVFIGTYGDGAFLYDKGRTLRLPMDRNGFLIHVHTFMPDERGMLWISSNRGLFRVSLSDIDAFAADTLLHVYFAYFGRDDGIANPEFNGGCDPAHVRMPDGRALFPTLEGLVEFDPAAVIDPLPKGRVLIESVSVDGQALDRSRELRILPGQKEMEIHFSLPYWGAAANVQIEYRLSGIQDQWLPIGETERELRFSRMPPGNYELLLRKLGAPSDEEPTRLSFEVQAPFYRQGWFMVLAALVVALLILLAVRLYELRLRQRNQELEQAVEERTREIEQANMRLRRSVEVKERLVSIISHDIVTPLRFIARVARSATRHAENGSERNDDLRGIALSSDKLYANANNLLSWIKHQEGRIELRPRHEALNPLVEEALDMVREMAAGQGDTLINDVPLDDVVRTDRDVLLIILQNILSNAVNYTKQGEVRVRGTQVGDQYELCICDTGPGITPKALAHVRAILAGQRGEKGGAPGDPEMQGLGYVIVGELTTLLGGTVVIGERPGGGAMITIRLPIRKDSTDPVG